jgi:hypothetical protein
MIEMVSKRGRRKVGREGERRGNGKGEEGRRAGNKRELKKEEGGQ